ncbi:hypothetical protein [Deinococcus aestuarii]|uniref:hypothetical protein n=1 Tax=Deinococcus aestuarii TaxID=2774531 RepID=UPI001C0E5D39|nr:hypothetical protein [Deinococcus aestuarii]
MAYLRKRLEKDDEVLKVMTAAGADPAEIGRLEAHKASVQRTLDLIISAGRRWRRPRHQLG